MRIKYSPTESIIILLTLLSGALMISALWFSPAPFLHDYAEWVYQAKILSLKLTSPESVEDFVLYPYPVPYALVQYAMAGFHLLFSPLLAGKLFVVAYIIVSYIVFGAFVKRFVPEGARRLAAWSFLVCVATYSSFFFYGFIGYQIGLLVFLYFFVFYRKTSTASMVAIYGILAFFIHATILLQFVLLVLLAVAFCGFPRKHIAALAPSGLLSVTFIVGRYLNSTVMHTGESSWASWSEAIIYKTGMVTMHGPFKNFILPSGASFLETYPAVYWSGVIVNVGAMLALGLLFTAALWRSWQLISKGAPENDNTKLLLLFCLSVVAIYSIAPFNFFGLVHPGGRLILPFVCVAIALIYAMNLTIPKSIALIVAGTTLVTASIYFSVATSVDSIAQLAVSKRGKPPENTRKSVLAYNQWLYRNTRYSYYNYRIFEFSYRYPQLNEQRYEGMSFRTGSLSHYGRAP